MAQYRFYAQREATNRPLSGVIIVHNPEICLGNGLNCDFPRVLQTRTINGNATIGMPNTQMDHWIQATYPGPPPEIQESNEYIEDFGGSRAMRFDF